MHSVSDMVKFLVINCDPCGREMRLDPTKSLEDLNQLVFNEIDRILETMPRQEHELRCPSCGHDESLRRSCSKFGLQCELKMADFDGFTKSACGTIGRRD